jgi:hypothetical protein
MEDVSPELKIDPAPFIFDKATKPDYIERLCVKMAGSPVVGMSSSPIDEPANKKIKTGEAGTQASIELNVAHVTKSNTITSSDGSMTWAVTYPDFCFACVHYVVNSINRKYNNAANNNMKLDLVLATLCSTITALVVAVNAEFETKQGFRLSGC